MSEFAIGQSIARREDPPLLRGQGRFFDDLRLADQLYATIVPHAGHRRYRHARGAEDGRRPCRAHWRGLSYRWPGLITRVGQSDDFRRGPSRSPPSLDLRTAGGRAAPAVHRRLWRTATLPASAPRNRENDPNTITAAKTVRFTALLHHITTDLLKQVVGCTRPSTGSRFPRSVLMCGRAARRERELTHRKN
jgi:hypothetical protein